MASKKEQRALLDHLASLRPDYDKVLKIMESTKEIPDLYHISKDGKIPAFIPFVTRRSIQEEDRSVPRVCVSENLWDCFAGYAAVVEDFDTSPDGFLGGYYIYSLPFKQAIIPKTDVLPDVEETNERWIVGYDEEHLEIKPTIIGKVFVRTISNTRNGRKINRQLTLYLEVFKDVDRLRVHENLPLTEGFYKLVVDGVVDRKSWNRSAEGVSVSLIEEKEYSAVKKQVASLLSFESMPASMKW